MITIQIDANLVHDENGEIYLSTATAEYFNLRDGEKVLVYEGNEIWNAIVHKFVLGNKELWYVEIEKSKIIQRMISTGYCIDEIETVINLNEELKERVKKLLQGNI